ERVRDVGGGDDLRGLGEGSAEAIRAIAAFAPIGLGDVEKHVGRGAAKLVFERRVGRAEPRKQRAKRTQEVERAVVSVEGHGWSPFRPSRSPTREDRAARWNASARALAGSSQRAARSSRGGERGEGDRRDLPRHDRARPVRALAAVTAQRRRGARTTRARGNGFGASPARRWAASARRAYAAAARDSAVDRANTRRRLRHGRPIGGRSDSDSDSDTDTD